MDVFRTKEEKVQDGSGAISLCQKVRKAHRKVGMSQKDTGTGFRGSQWAHERQSKHHNE